MMKYSSLSPILYSTQLSETVKFYTERLRFELIEFDQELNRVKLRCGISTVEFWNPPTTKPFEAPVLTGYLRIGTPQLIALWNRVKNEVKVVVGLDIYDDPLGYFCIEDNNGYRLIFSEPTQPDR